MAFYILSFLVLVSALGVILARNPFYAVLSLVSVLFALSGLFILLQAYFVAAIQILVYAGAILVLFLFVLMLLEMTPESLVHTRTRTLRIAGSLVGGFFLLEVVAVAGLYTLKDSGHAPALVGTTETIGRELFTTYALPFELASMLILVGIIGAVVLAKKKL